MDWTDVHETHFWHERAPCQMKYEIEKLTGMLLTLGKDPAGKLVYRGESTLGHTFVIEIRFEAVLPRAPYVMKPPTERREFRNLYTLRLTASAPEKWYTKAELESDAHKAFEYWTLRLQCCPAVTDFSDRSEKFYKEQVRQTIEYEEAEAKKVEDPDPIIALQKQVLEALRKGKQFRTAHHEGGSILFFNGKSFAREDYGLEPDLKVFATDEEMIACIRNFFDWESRRDSYPHRPPEIEVWKFIQRQLL